MRQLQLLIDRKNLKRSPKEDMNAAGDFMKVVTAGHVLQQLSNTLEWLIYMLHHKDWMR